MTKAGGLSPTVELRRVRRTAGEPTGQQGES